MPPKELEQRLHAYLDERSLYAGSPATVERTIATVFDGGRRSRPVRSRRLFVGIAIAAIIRMIATTINNSMSENPFCFRIFFTFFSIGG